jgi:hypothetical protein
MNSKKWNYKTSSEKLYGVYFRLINGMLKLTNKEIEVASELYHNKYEVDKAIADNKLANEFLFSVQKRKQMRDRLGMSSLLFNNYLQALKEKKIITEVDGLKYLNKGLEISPESDLSITFDVKLQPTLQED